jgi:uncharacterized membrane protein
MLTLCNEYHEPIWTAISFWEPDDCSAEGNGWHDMGWWHIEPGSCKRVYGNDLDDVDNRYWYVYAEADDGARWSGDYPTHVTMERFSFCDEPPNTNMVIRGFDEIDVGDFDNYTLTFIE